VECPQATEQPTGYSWTLFSLCVCGVNFSEFFSRMHASVIITTFTAISCASCFLRLHAGAGWQWGCKPVA
jgi:hypothetical protein